MWRCEAQLVPCRVGVHVNYDAQALKEAFMLLNAGAAKVNLPLLQAKVGGTVGELKAALKVHSFVFRKPTQEQVPAPLPFVRRAIRSFFSLLGLFLRRNLSDRLTLGLSYQLIALQFWLGGAENPQTLPILQYDRLMPFHTSLQLYSAFSPWMLVKRGPSHACTKFLASWHKAGD